MEEHGDCRTIAKDDAAAVKPARSFRYEDYSTRRVFLRSYPLQWDRSESDDKQQQQDQLGDLLGYHSDGDDDVHRRCGGSRGWRRQVAVAVLEWGEEKMLLLRRARKRLAMYLLGCHHGRTRALPFGSGKAAMLASR